MTLQTSCLSVMVQNESDSGSFYFQKTLFFKLNPHKSLFVTNTLLKAKLLLLLVPRRISCEKVRSQRTQRYTRNNCYTRKPYK